MAAEGRAISYTSAQFSVTLDSDVVLMLRTQVPLGMGRNLEQALATMRHEVQRAAGATKARGLVLDFRRAPARTDDEFEASFARVRVHMAHGFQRVAFLMSGTVGKLQAQRYARDDGLGAQAFLNEKLALAFARSGSRP